MLGNEVAFRQQRMEVMTNSIVLNMECVQDYLGKLASVQAKGDDYEIAAAQIGVEVYSALSSAVGAS